MKDPKFSYLFVKSTSRVFNLAKRKGKKRQRRDLSRGEIELTSKKDLSTEHKEVVAYKT